MITVPAEVSVSPDLIAKAKSDFPPGGSVDGTPSFEIFEHGPLDAARRVFSRRFDETPEPIPGLAAMRQWDTLSSIFGPLIFFAVKTGDRVVIMDYLYDPDYWDLVNDDPIG